MNIIHVISLLYQFIDTNISVIYTTDVFATARIPDIPNTGNFVTELFYDLLRVKTCFFEKVQLVLVQRIKVAVFRVVTVDDNDFQIRENSFGSNVNKSVGVQPTAIPGGFDSKDFFHAKEARKIERDNAVTAYIRVFRDERVIVRNSPRPFCIDVDSPFSISISGTVPHICTIRCDVRNPRVTPTEQARPNFFHLRNDFLFDCLSGRIKDFVRFSGRVLILKQIFKHCRFPPSFSYHSPEQCDNTAYWGYISGCRRYSSHCTPDTSQ